VQVEVREGEGDEAKSLRVMHVICICNAQMHPRKVNQWQNLMKRRDLVELSRFLSIAASRYYILVHILQYSYI